MKKKNNTLTKLAILAGGALVLNEAAKATDRSANLPTQSVSKESETIKNEVIKELTKLIQDDVKIQSLLKPNNGLNGTDGKDGIVILAKTEENQNQITTSILSGDAIVVLNQHNKLAADGMTGMAINQVIRVDTEIETLISFYISPGFSQQNVNYLPTIQDLQGNILTGPGGEFSEMITEAECFSAIGGYIILKVNEGGALEIVNTPVSPTNQDNLIFAKETNSTYTLHKNSEIFFPLSSAGVTHNINVLDSVTKIVCRFSDEFSPANTLTLSFKVNNQNILLADDSTIAEFFSFNTAGNLSKFSGSVVTFFKDGGFWYAEQTIPKNFVSNQFNYLTNIAVYTGASAVTLNLPNIASNNIKKDVVYEIVNSLNTGLNVTVNFPVAPHLYTATSFIIKGFGTSASISPTPTEFRNSFRFMYSSALNKFIIIE